MALSTFALGLALFLCSSATDAIKTSETESTLRLVHMVTSFL